MQVVFNLKVFLFSSLNRLGLIEQINPGEPHHRSIRLVVLNICLFKLLRAWILVHRLSCFLNELVWHPLRYFDTVIRLVRKHLPLEHWFLRVELHAVEWVSAGLPYRHEFLVVRWGCLRNHLPEIAQLLVCIVCVYQNGLLVVVVSHSLPSCQLVDQFVSQTLEDVPLVPSNELYAVDDRLLSSDWWQRSNSVAGQVS